MSLMYSVPSGLLKRIGINALTVAIVSRNPFILHKNVPNVDPDSTITMVTARDWNMVPCLPAGAGV